MVGSTSEDPNKAKHREKIIEAVSYIKHLLEHDMDGYRALADQTRVELRKEGVEEDCTEPV